MTITEVIILAERWQESVSHDGDRDAMERIATQFSYALLILNLERQAAMQTLADSGFGEGQLHQRIQAAIGALCNKVRQ